jgi:hypothetical protein
MKRTVLATLLVVSCALVATPMWANAEYPSVEKQMKLDEGMTMEQLRALLGNPDRTEQSICSAAESCRVWIYSGEVRRFRVVFRKGDSAWVVDSWTS